MATPKRPDDKHENKVVTAGGENTETWSTDLEDYVGEAAQAADAAEEAKASAGKQSVAAPSSQAYTIDDFVKEYGRGNSRFLTKDENKRRMRDNLFSSIGDAVSALSSMYHATKGGVPVYEPSESMSAATKKRYDDLISQRRADYAQYLNAQRMDDLRSWREQQAAQKQAELQEKARVNDSRIAANAALIRQRESAGAAADELAELRRYQTLLERNKAEGYPAYLQAQIEEYESRTRRNEASAAASSANANLANTRADYVGGEREVTEVDEYGNRKTRTSVQRPRNGGRQGGGAGTTPPSRQKKNNNTPPSRRK